MKGVRRISITEKIPSDDVIEEFCRDIDTVIQDKGKIKVVANGATYLIEPTNLYVEELG